MKEILPLKSKIGQLFQVLYSMLKFPIFCLKFCFPFSCLHWVKLPFYSLYVLHPFLNFRSDFPQILKRNPTEKTMWSDCWPRHGQPGVLRGSQTGTMMIFCGFREWIVADIETLHQIPFQGMTCPRSGSAVRRWPPALSSSRDCLRAEGCLIWAYILPRRPHPLADCRGGIVVWSSRSKGYNYENHLNPPVPCGVGWGQSCG